MALIKEEVQATWAVVSYWKVVGWQDRWPDNIINVWLDGYLTKADRLANRQQAAVRTISFPAIQFSDRHNPLPEIYNQLKQDGFFEDAEDDLAIQSNGMDTEGPIQEG